MKAGRIVALSPEQISDVARLYREGWSEFQLSDRFGVSRDTIQRALAHEGVQKRSHAEGREAARNSGWRAWRMERRAAAANPFHINEARTQ